MAFISVPDPAGFTAPTYMTLVSCLGLTQGTGPCSHAGSPPAPLNPVEASAASMLTVLSGYLAWEDRVSPGFRAHCALCLEALGTFCHSHTVKERKQKKQNPPTPSALQRREGGREERKKTGNKDLYHQVTPGLTAKLTQPSLKSPYSNDVGAYLSTVCPTLQHLPGPHFLDQAALYS